MVWERRKIEPKPVGNTHPNPVTSTPLTMCLTIGWLSSPKVEDEEWLKEDEYRDGVEKEKIDK